MARLLAPTPKPIIVHPVHANTGVEMMYRLALQDLIRQMNNDLMAALMRDWRTEAPSIGFAADASLTVLLKRSLLRVSKQWVKRFDDLSTEMAAKFANGNFNVTQTQIRAAFQASGFTVKFKPTAKSIEAYRATIAENVGLIKTIPQEYLGDVQGTVWRAVMKGGDLATLTRSIEENYGVAHRRAAFIARDQNNKASAIIQNVRQQELGITHARWHHSAAGRVPRPTHVAMDGKIYELKQGMWDSAVGEWVWPGQLPNCFPGDTEVGLETRPLRIWRTPFNGPMIHLQIGSDLLKGTANHPILTSNGWKRMDQLNCGDQVVCMTSDHRKVVDHDEGNRKTTIGDLFEAHRVLAGGYVRMCGRGFDFHGHIPDQYVDEVIVIDHKLSPYRKAGLFHQATNLGFSQSDPMVGLKIISRIAQIAATYATRFLNDATALINRLIFKSRTICATGTTDTAVHGNYIEDVGCRMPGETHCFSDGGRPHARRIHSHDRLSVRPPVNSPIDNDANGAQLLADFVSVMTDQGRSVFEFRSRTYELRSVSNQFVRDFSGHVYTMETMDGHYSVSGAYAQAKNCRCTQSPIIPGLEDDEN